MLNDIRITLTIVCLKIGIFFLDCGVKGKDLFKWLASKINPCKEEK